MAVYALSGGATGIGAAIKSALLARGDRVIVVDLNEGDICADLSTEAGRAKAVSGVRALTNTLDGIIPCAGLGPSVKSPALITQVNYFGAVSFVEGLQDLLKPGGRIVMIGSNSAPMAPHDDFVDLMLAGKETEACEFIAEQHPQSAYAGSKHALLCWMRRHCLALAGNGILMNAVAPGFVDTPLSDKVLADKELGEVTKAFCESVPIGRVAKPAEVADVVLFLLGEQARYICGSVLFIDGGHDAMLRPDSF
ncbi:SDR family oxidoreductase [Spongiibacter sp. KMU-158]|uniref:SDR family oxidoreductase n=1 Tax=Spongiibacter pelagi TaxID=2760804 RepID=A0A927GWD1_9GAMM|nr:SDR family oxidoreductase [Spongiibacter pelagi]MBD2858304.1 SDR family oxidoreductase [Spongiibacter pelagi]